MKKLPVESALRWAETFAAGCYDASRTPAERNSSLGVTSHACVTLAREVRLLRKALAANQTAPAPKKRTLAQTFFRR